MTKPFYFLVLLLFCFVKLCCGQLNSTKEIQEKISIGAWFERNNFYLINGSYSRIGKKENEMVMSLYYAKEKNTNELFWGCGFYYSFFKKKSLLDLLTGPEIIWNLHWFKINLMNDNYAKRYGPFICLGILPIVNFSNRLSISLENKMGYGYQFSNSVTYTSNNKTYTYSEKGWYYLWLKAIKINYKF